MAYDKKLIFRAGTIPYIIEDDRVLMMFMKPSNTRLIRLTIRLGFPNSMAPFVGRMP